MDPVSSIFRRFRNAKARTDAWPAEAKGKQDCKQRGRWKQPTKMAQDRILASRSIALPSPLPIEARGGILWGGAAACVTATNPVRQSGQRPAADRGMLAPQAEQDAGTGRRNIGFPSS